MVDLICMETIFRRQDLISAGTQSPRLENISLLLHHHDLPYHEQPHISRHTGLSSSRKVAALSFD